MFARTVRISVPWARAMFAVVLCQLAVARVPLTAAAQDTGVLRISVTLTDANGTTTPIPRVMLLVSDNPATAEPRRVRTGADGTVSLTVRAGNYTIETDQPVVLGAQAFAWTQTLDVTAGRDTTLALTPANADVEAVTAAASSAAPGSRSAPMRADAAVVFNTWRRSVVELWTPTGHATGFIVHDKGLIATDYRAIAEAAAVEVEISASASPGQRPADGGRIKIPGRVVVADRVQGVTMIWIDPSAIDAVKPVPAGCDGAAATPVEYGDRIITIAAPMLEPEVTIAGTVGRVESRSFEVDWRLDRTSTGGPVFAGEGDAVGITIANEEQERGSRDAAREVARVLPLSNVCTVLAAAEKKIAGATPPPATRLRVEPAAAAPTFRRPPDPKAPRLQAPTVSSSSFDITMLTPAMVRDEPSMTSPRTDFGNWTEYVAGAPPVLLIRVSPQFEESFWKTIARGAAQTQGVALPPLKSFSANFLRMRAYCDAAEVAPIHPLVIERRVSERGTIREGLYVFGLDDFNQCGAVRFELFSEKSPDKPDTKSVDPKLLARIAMPPG